MPPRKDSNSPAIAGGRALKSTLAGVLTPGLAFGREGYQVAVADIGGNGRPDIIAMGSVTANGKWCENPASDN